MVTISRRTILFVISSGFINYIQKFSLIRKGHGEYIFNIISRALFSDELRKKLTDKTEENVKYGSSLNIVIEYIATVLLEYTDFKKGKFMENKYFLEVYSKNVDVWGLIIIYMEYILNPIMGKILPSNVANKFLVQISQLLYKFLCSS